jgi:hypothetical protein
MVGDDTAICRDVRCERGTNDGTKFNARIEKKDEFIEVLAPFRNLRLDCLLGQEA